MTNMNDFVKLIYEKYRDIRLETKYQLTLVQLICKLERVNPNSPIFIDDSGYSPGKAMSYRGYYCELSFDYGDICTVEDFWKVCKDAVGKTFMGYKGGEFTMSLDTLVWIANYSYTGRMIVGVVEHSDKVLLLTEEDI